MPRSRPGDGTIRLRTDGRYYAYLTWRGRQHGRAAVPNTEAGARKALAELKRLRDRGELRRTRAPSVEAVYQHWIESVHRQVEERERSPNTEATYRRVAEGHVLPHLGRLAVDKLRVDDVDGWQRDLARAGVGAASRQYALTVLRAMLKDAERREILSRNVARLARPVAVQRRQIRPFGVGDALAVQQAVRGTRIEAAVLLALGAGLREAEIAGLRWRDVDLDRGTLTVREQRRRVPVEATADGRRAEQAPPKGKRPREVALLGFAIDALVRQRQRQREERIRAGRRWTETGHVVTAINGQPLTASGIGSAWLRLRRRAGLDDLRFHDLRHGWSTLAHQHGIDDEIRAAQLGHTRVEQTHGYTEVSVEVLREAARRLDRALGG